MAARTAIATVASARLPALHRGQRKRASVASYSSSLSGSPACHSSLRHLNICLKHPSQIKWLHHGIDTPVTFFSKHTQQSSIFFHSNLCPPHHSPMIMSHELHVPWKLFSMWPFDSRFPQTLWLGHGNSRVQYPLTDIFDTSVSILRLRWTVAQRVLPQ